MSKWHNWTRIGLLGCVALGCNSSGKDESAENATVGGAVGSAPLGGATATGGSSPTGGASTVQSVGGDRAVGGSGNAPGAVSTKTIGSGGAINSSCTTQPPTWSDCDGVGEFPSPVPVAAGGTSNTSAPESLTAVQDTALVAAPIREQAKAQILSQYSNYWTTQRTQNCSPRVVCPSTGKGGSSSWASAATPSVKANSSTGGTASAASSSETRSGTNNQVVGVDEPDLMKLDARYVYIVTPTELVTLDAQNPAMTTLASRLKLEGTPKSLLLSGDRALVIASTGKVSQKASCTYAYDCQFNGDGYGTVLLVVDIADRTKPRILRRIEFSGSYLAGRLIGSVAHVVTTDGFKKPAINWTSPSVSSKTASEALSTLKTQYDAAAASVETASVTFTFPTTTDQRVASNGTAEAAVSVQPNQFHASVGLPNGVVTVSSIDFASTEPLHQDMILSNPGAVYASEDLLYLAIPEVNSNYPGYGVDASWIHGFVLSGAAASYKGSGRVKGHVLNQFSLDEYEGHLRVATSTGRVPDPSVHSTVSVLGWSDSRLIQQGVVDKIAPTEDIRAVRFVGPRGYVVTFKKTDPLFVLDLAEPTAPKMQGELKIPGFSTYIHPLDERHLLSMGYDADDQGSFAYFNGIQLQIMDVTDPIAPALLFKETIGTRGSSSEALTDHLAFNYFAPKQMLAIPMTICEGGGNGRFADVLTFTGLLVYDVSVGSGFKLHGRVPHPAPSGYFGTGSQPTCSNWWTNASSPVKRSAFIDDYILSLGDALVKVDPLASLGNSVATFPVGTVPCEGLAETDCKLNSRCQSIRGTVLGANVEEYLGCASIPTGQSKLTCTTGTKCIGMYASKACATVASSCVPDGWGSIAAAACTIELCGP